MKKIKFLIILSIFITTFFLCPLHSTSMASQNVAYYGKVMNDNVYFYSNPISNDESKLFAIPKSYFVYITEEANGDFYVAQYKDLYGYVKKEEITVMNGTPTVPFANVNFTVFDFDGLDLFPTANFTNNTSLASIPYLTVIGTYYGEISGENIPNMNKNWYYCKYNKNQTNVYGYVYSAFCYEKSNLELNNESFDIVENPVFTSNFSTEEKLSDVAMAFIIIGVSLPCLIILYLLIKPSFQKDKVAVNKKPAKKRHGDYFEFDENDLN